MTLKPSSQSARAVFFFLLTPLLISLLTVGCSKSKSHPSVGDGAKPAPGVAPASGVVTCATLLSQTEVDTIAGQLDLSSVSGLQGGDGQDCKTDAGDMSQRFAKVVIVPSFKIGASTSFKQADGAPPTAEWVADIATVSGEASADLIAKVRAAVAAATRGRSIAVEAGTLPTFVAVTLGDDAQNDGLAQVPHEMLPGALRFHVPASINEAFGAHLKSYDAGQIPLVLAEGSNIETGTVAVGQFKNGDTVQFANFEGQGAADYLTGLWKRIGETHGASTDTTLPFFWMDEARVWWPNLKLQPVDGQKMWPAAWAQASFLWTQPGDRTDQVGPISSLKALRFLLTIDPTNSALVYAQQAQQLAGILGPDDTAIYAALMDLSEHLHATPAQAKAVLDLASALAPKASSPADAWHQAVAAATKVNQDPAKLNAIRDGAAWLEQVHPDGNSIAVAMGWVADQGVDQARINQLKGVFDDLTKNGHADHAWDKSVDLVITKKLSKAQTDAYLKLVKALATAHQADPLAKADDYVLMQNLSPAVIDALAVSITWLNGVPGVTDPIGKSEDYLLKQKLNPDDVIRMQGLYTWMLGTSHNLTALQDAEEFVIQDKLSPSETAGLQLAYSWLAYTPQGGQSFDLAKDYVVGKHLTLDQIEQLKTVGEWLASSTPVGAAGAVAKAQYYVMEKKLTPIQTELLSTAYVWLHDTVQLHEDQVLPRAENEVLNLGLTPEKLVHLEQSFDSHKASGDPDPLTTAEKEVLSSGNPFGGFFGH